MFADSIVLYLCIIYLKKKCVFSAFFISFVHFNSNIEHTLLGSVRYSAVWLCLQTTFSINLIMTGEFLIFLLFFSAKQLFSLV